MQYKHIVILIALAMLGIGKLSAQSVSFNASAPRMVEVGEKFRIQYSVNTQNVSDFTPPSFSGLEVIYGPSTSSQSSIQIINGQMTQSSSYTYTYTVYAEKVGTVTVQPASIQSDGKTYKSQSLKIQVVEATGGRQGGGYSQQGQQQSQRSQQSRSQASSSSISGSDLFMTATASRTNVYEQEAILLTYKVYTLVNLTQLDGKLPTLDGFQIQEIPLPRNKEFSVENYNGRNYHTVVWSQYVLFPQKAGKLVIPAITYEGVVVQQNRAIDPIEAFFNGTGGMIEVKKKITTPQLTINVASLPNKPDNFSGAVGSFSLSSSISGESVKTNDAITLKIQVKGTGNMKLISTPEVDFPKDFETYDAKVNDKFSLTHSGLSGTKEFEYLAVPRHAGKYKIPAVEFVYFDTGSHTYKTLKTEPYEIKVAKGAGGSSQSVADYASNQQDIKELNQDIRYIKTNNITLRQRDDSFFGSWKYWLSYLLPVLLFVIILAIGHKHIKDNANIAKTRGKKANKIANKRLKVASKLLAQKNQNEFYDEVMRALWGYIADKLNIPQSDLNKENINAALQQKSVEQPLIDSFIKTLNDCEFARYAPGDANENMEAVYDSAVNVISQMENNIKNAKKVANGRMASVAIAFLLCGISLSASAQTKQEADSLYAHEEYEAAANAYEAIIAKQGIAAELYYNLGNCYYKLDEVALSVLNYERAALLNPSDADTKANLELARAKTTDKITPASEMFFVSWWRNLTNIMSLNSWITIGLIAFILMLIGILLYAFIPNVTIRKIGIYGAIFCLALTVVANLCSLSQHLMQTNRDFAVIMSPAVTVKSSPSESSTDLFVVHEGSKVEILDDTMTDWCEVKLEEGKVGWIPAETLERI